jgi:hypothetical protein
MIDAICFSCVQKAKVHSPAPAPRGQTMAQKIRSLKHANSLVPGTVHF